MQAALWQANIPQIHKSAEEEMQKYAQKSPGTDRINK